MRTGCAALHKRVQNCKRMRFGRELRVTDPAPVAWTKCHGGSDGEKETHQNDENDQNHGAETFTQEGHPFHHNTQEGDNNNSEEETES